MLLAVVVLLLIAYLDEHCDNPLRRRRLDGTRCKTASLCHLHAGFGGVHDGEVDFGLGNFVEIVREAIFRDEGDDFHDLRVGEPGIAYGRNVRLASW